MIGEFETRIHCPELDDSVPVFVHILKAEMGAPATRWEPMEDPYLELAVYHEDSDQDAWPHLSADEQEQIIDEAFDYLKQECAA